jgi:hypothetical protein
MWRLRTDQELRELDKVLNTVSATKRRDFNRLDM